VPKKDIWLQETVTESAAISPPLLGQIIPETCTAIYEELASHYMKLKVNSISNVIK
jgi:hypothetical protein